MEAVTENVVHSDGLNLHFIHNKKYKTINIVVKLKAPLERETITHRALLPYILQQGTLNYPGKKELQRKLDELYGAVLSVDGSKKGEQHIISFRLEVPNEKFIPNESAIVEEGINLLGELLFEPNVENEAFSKSVVKREKDTLKQKIHAIKDDKMSYANLRLIDEMCKGEAFSLHVHGYQEDLEKITPENLYTYYKQAISENQLDVYVQGDFDEKALQELLVAKLKREEVNSPVKKETTNSEKNAREFSEVVEKENIQQAKLHIGYRTNCTYRDEGYYALQVFNGMFGGFPSSKLFINVREKNSLAYYASSRLESQKGLLIVFSGIAPKDYKQASTIMNEQLEAMKNGDFTEEELEETKDLIVNQLRETMDHPQGMVELLYQQVLAETERSPEQLIKGIKAVKRDEVITAAKKIEADTLYLLTSKDGEGNE
ncbi:EF-P 5-aminopentanol modification-associated protein YfmF [Oceanobacillus manasiensis]|uniref:EF-P 5-aminopentanol modification-associated protein YfmF n=1 Tax=Oceanobacillus manasiensis TaxID=586413 RepID=UPI0005A8BCFF|nr:pitrilysin family protein [Oceanobacillus manasiensis]